MVFLRIQACALWQMGRNLILLSQTSSAPLLLSDANDCGSHHRKPIKQQQRRSLSSLLVCMAWAVWGGDTFCQLALGLFNYSDLRCWVNLIDLWICSSSICQEPVKTLLHGPSAMLSGPMTMKQKNLVGENLEVKSCRGGEGVLTTNFGT